MQWFCIFKGLKLRDSKIYFHLSQRKLSFLLTLLTALIALLNDLAIMEKIFVEEIVNEGTDVKLSVAKCNIKSSLLFYIFTYCFGMTGIYSAHFQRLFKKTTFLLLLLLAPTMNSREGMLQASCSLVVILLVTEVVPSQWQCQHPQRDLDDPFLLAFHKALKTWLILQTFEHLSQSGYELCYYGQLIVNCLSLGTGGLYCEERVFLIL